MNANEKMPQRIICECGKDISWKGYLKHSKTKNHLFIIQKRLLCSRYGVEGEITLLNR